LRFLSETPRFVEVYGGTIVARQYVVAEIQAAMACAVFGCDEATEGDNFYKIDLDYFLRRDISR
jgi:hypothetical protein